MPFAKRAAASQTFPLTFATRRGHCWPFGATSEPDGVNFAVFSRHAERIDLVLFSDGVDEEELAAVRSNMEKLIQKKLEMFPTDLRQIVVARIFKSGDKDRIEIMSARVG